MQPAGSQTVRYLELIFQVNRASAHEFDARLLSMTTWIHWPDLFPHADSHEPGAAPHAYRVLDQHARFETRAYASCGVLETPLLGLSAAAFRQGANALVGLLRKLCAQSEVAVVSAEFKPLLLAYSDTGGACLSVMLALRLTQQLARVNLPPGFVLRGLPSRVIATLTYDGGWSARNDAVHLRQLRRELLKEGLEALGSPLFARFNHPYSLPCLRRNEAWLTLATSDSPPLRPR